MLAAKDQRLNQEQTELTCMHVVHVKYPWASLHRSGCVLVIVALQWRPPEDVRESRLRRVTKHHCHSAKGFNWKALQQRKRSSSVHCLAPLNPFPPPHTHTYTLSYNSPPRPLSVPRESNEPIHSSELKRDESGELEFPDDCWHPLKMTLFFSPLPHYFVMLP